MTQEALAHLCDLSASHVGQIERGMQTASLETVLRICHALRQSLDWIVRGVDPAGKDPFSGTGSARILNEMARILSEHADEWFHQG